MNAALFAMDSWLGHQEYIFTGESAAQIVAKFEDIQDLGCLVRMGRENERGKKREEVAKLAAFYEKYCSGNLSMQDLLSLDASLSVGGIACTEIAETDEEIEALRAKHPKAL